MHAGQLAISAGQVRALVGRQFAQWREMPVREIISGGMTCELMMRGWTPASGAAKGSWTFPPTPTR
jgi:hypothetical protein